MIKWVLIVLLLSACVAHPEERKMAAAQNVQLGFAYLNKNNTALAKTHFLLALKDDAESVFALDGMAYFYESVGDYSKAQTYYEAALTYDVGVANNNYGAFLCRHGEPEKGVKQFMLAVKAPRYVHVGEAYENAAKCTVGSEAAYFQRQAILHGVKGL